MTVRLRPHHLLCLLTYVGKGYTPAFVENYDRIAQRLSEGEGIVVVDGPDDVAQRCSVSPNRIVFARVCDRGMRRRRWMLVFFSM